MQDVRAVACMIIVGKSINHVTHPILMLSGGAAGVEKGEFGKILKSQPNTMPIPAMR